MNSRYNKQEYVPNLTNRTRGKSTIYRPGFIKDHVKNRLSKSNFQDSDDDCYILPETTDEHVDRASSSLKTNPFGTIFNKQRYTLDNTKPISFKPRGLHHTADDKINFSGVNRNNSNNQFVNITIEKTIPIPSQSEDSDTIVEERTKAIAVDKDSTNIANDLNAPLSSLPTAVYLTPEERYKLLEDLDNCIVSIINQ